MGSWVVLTFGQVRPSLPSVPEDPLSYLKGHMRTASVLFSLGGGIACLAGETSPLLAQRVLGARCSQMAGMS